MTSFSTRTGHWNHSIQCIYHLQVPAKPLFLPLAGLADVLRCGVIKQLLSTSVLQYSTVLWSGLRG